MPIISQNAGASYFINCYQLIYIIAASQNSILSSYPQHRYINFVNTCCVYFVYNANMTTIFWLFICNMECVLEVDLFPFAGPGGICVTFGIVLFKWEIWSSSHDRV